MPKREDKNGLIKPYKNKGYCEPLETDDTTAILDMIIDASERRKGRPFVYPNTPQGLEQFANDTKNYFEYVNNVNSNPNLKQKLIPDIENWAVYLGITRQTILSYEQRGGAWSDCISFFKNAIGALKKQLALNYKIPPMVYVFDATNNHGYVNSNEFKLTATTAQDNTATLEQQIAQSGLVWNDITKEFEPQ